MDSEDQTAIKLMIAALNAYDRAKRNISGLGWASLMGGVDKKYRSFLLFDDIDRLTSQMFKVTKHL